MTDPNSTQQPQQPVVQPAGKPDGAPVPPPGQPQHGEQSQHGQPQYGQPRHDQPQYGQQYGQTHGHQYAPPQDSPYGQPYAMGPRTNTLAIIALIAAFVFPPAGIICGHIALGQIKATGEAGNGLALAGVIIGYVWAAFLLLMILSMVVFPLIMMGVLFPTLAGIGAL